MNMMKSKNKRKKSSPLDTVVALLAFGVSFWLSKTVANVVDSSFDWLNFLIYAVVFIISFFGVLLIYVIVTEKDKKKK